MYDFGQGTKFSELSFPHLQSKGNSAFLVYLQRFHK